MAVEVQMPKLGLTMQEGTVAEWIVADGEPVTAGTPIMVISTDKVETEYEVGASGILRHVAGSGETLDCGAVVAWLVEEGEEPPTVAPTPSAAGSPTAAPAAASPPPPPAPDGGGRLIASPNARRVAAERGVDLATVRGTGPGGRITSEDVEAASVPAAPAAATATAEIAAGDGRFVPLVARKVAEKLGIDIASVAGSGPQGRVTRSDVYAAARAGAASASAAAETSGPGPGDRVPVEGMRRIIAERMHGSLHEMAQLTLGLDAEMDRVVELREQFKEIGVDELGAVPGFTDFVIAAAARALRDHPMVNASMVGDEIHVQPDVNVGMAVALPDGLIVPVVHHADRLPLPDLAVETSRLAAAARDGRLSMHEIEGGTFSVTALGMFGVDVFTPIVNPPNAAILGVGRIRDAVRWDGDRPVRRQVMTLSLTWDHRVIDGAPAAEFASTVASYLEAPLRLLA